MVYKDIYPYKYDPRFVTDQTDDTKHLAIFICTPIGDLSEKEWTEAAVKLIEENHDTKLFEAILSHITKDHGIKEEAAKQCAAEFLITGAWKPWETDGSFKYEEQ